MSKYKVGDKVKVVRIIKENSKHREKYIGETFTIREWNPNGSHLEEHYGVVEECPYIFFVDELEPYVEEKKMFTKSDLKNGDIILRNNGEVEIAIVDLGVFISKSGWMPLNRQNEDLTYDNGDSYWDIKAVRRPNKEYGCQFCAFENNWGELVYDRERDTKKLYNGKVVCVNLNGYNKGAYTVGKIYEFKNGRMTDDTGYTFGEDTDAKFYTFEDWANFASSKFIEVVE